jgi:hypothetical protein
MDKPLRKTVYRHRLNDGLGKKFRIHVTIWVEDLFHDGEWHEVMSGDACRKIETAVEKKYPGWYHRCYNIPSHKMVALKKVDCPACKRLAEVKRLTSIKSLI